MGFYIFLSLCNDMSIFQLSVPAKQITPTLSDLKQQQCALHGGSVLVSLELIHTVAGGSTGLEGPEWPHSHV